MGLKRSEDVVDARILQEPIHHLDPPLADRVNVEVPLADAIAQMQKVTSEHYRGTGALLITQKGKLTGIITERDLVRRVIKRKKQKRKEKKNKKKEKEKTKNTKKK